MMRSSIAILLILPLPLFADVDTANQILDADEDVAVAAIAAMDFNGNGQIDAGVEARAVLRFVNDKVFRQYDADHDGKLTGTEARNYVEKEVQPALDLVDAYFALSAYDKADKRFATPIPVTDPDAVIDRSPLAPRISKLALSVSYGQKGEAGKDVETIEAGFEYRWGSFAFQQTPIGVGTKLTYGKENTFLLTDTNKVERWTLEPFRLTLGAGQWDIEPTIGLGYGRTRDENVPAVGIPTSEESDEFVWNYGFAVPLKGDWAKFTITQTLRLDNIASGKESDEAKVGLEFDFQKLLRIPK